MNSQRHRVSFKSENLTLEGVLHSLDVTEPTPAVVVCHPHPLYGGAMNSNVVFSVCQELNKRGIIALRFNFRGVGASEGSFAEGEGETNDALAALSFLATLPNVDEGRLGVAGYSFGAYVSMRAAIADERIQAVAAISPAVTLADMSFFGSYSRPKMLISGAEDDLVPAAEFVAFANKVAEPVVIDVVPGADHFWPGVERWLGGKVADFFADVFVPSN